MAMIKVTPDVNPLSQQFSTCCWYTSLQMMFDWKWRKVKKDEKKEPWDILKKMDNSKDLYPYYMHDNGISPRECKETAKMLGLRWSGDGDFTANILYDMLTTHGPLWVAGMWRRGSSHVIVVTGVDQDSGNIKYVDPWENYSLKDSSGTVAWLNSRGDVWKNCDASVMYWF